VLAASTRKAVASAKLMVLMGDATISMNSVMD
jgi:hypothetical protein